MYLNTSNGDVYQKEADGWKLKMNIQGEDGEDGKDGHNGSNGSTGPKGDTAWSNTILPTTGGNIGVNLGSAVEGSEVIFTFEPDDNYSLAEVTLNGEKITNIDAPVEGVYSYKTTMVKNGFVVAAKFEASDKVGTTSYFENGVLYTGGKVDAFGNVIEKGQAQTGDDSPKFSSGDGLTAESALVIDDINNIYSLGKESIAETGAKYFELAKGLSSNENKVTINTDTINNLFEGKTGQEKEVFLNLGENNVDLPNSGNAYAVSGGANVEISNGIIDNSLKTSNTTSADINVKDGSTLTLNNVELLSKGGLMAEGSASTLNILNSKVESSVYGFGTNAAVEGQNVEINIISSEISSNTDDGDNAGLYVNIPCNVYIEDTVISGDRQGMFVRQGNVTLKNVTIEYGENINNFASLVTKNNNYLNGNWGSGNEIPSAALVLGDRSNTVNYQEVDSTVNVDGLKIKNRYANESLSVLADEKNTKTPTYYLYAYDNTPEKNSFTLNIDKESYDKIPSEKMFNKDVIINVEGVEATSTNTFVDGQLYSELYLKDDGSVDETLSTKVDEVKFADGDGTENSPLIVNQDNYKLINTIYDLNLLDNSDLYFKQNGNITANESIKNFSGHYDGGNNELYFSPDFTQDGKAGGFFGSAFGNIDLKNINMVLDEDQPYSLVAGTWSGGSSLREYVKNANFENISVKVLGDGTINLNYTNYSFIVWGVPYTPNYTEDVEWNFKNVDIKGSIVNGGTNTAAYIGSGPYSNSNPYNIKLNFEDCDFVGNVSANTYAGVLWGNPYYSDASKTKEVLNVANCTFDGILQAGTSADIITYGDNVKDDFISLNKELKSNGIAVSDNSEFRVGNKLENIENVSLTYNEETGFSLKEPVIDGVSSYKLCVNISQIVFETDDNGDVVSQMNGRKLEVNFTNADQLSNEAISNVYALESNDAAKIIGEEYSGNFDYKVENFDVGIFVKNETLYVIFDSENKTFESIKPTSQIVLQGLDDNGYIVGSKNLISTHE